MTVPPAWGPTAVREKNFARWWRGSAYNRSRDVDVALGWRGAGRRVDRCRVNVVTMRRLWRSVLFERSQKIAQTILLWLVPGSFTVVRHYMRPDVAGRLIVTFQFDEGQRVEWWTGLGTD